jgi:hypothetical protein
MLTKIIKKIKLLNKRHKGRLKDKHGSTSGKMPLQKRKPKEKPKLNNGETVTPMKPIMISTHNIMEYHQQSLFITAHE